MAIKHHNQEYDGGSPNLPLALGDRYYSQDLGRDFHYLRNLVGKVLADMGQTLPALVSGGVVTKGTGDTLNITPAVGYAKHEVDLPDAFSAIPPAVIQEDIILRAESTQQTNMAVPGATLDGSTVNYVKLRYAEVDGDSRARAKKAGSYYYEQSAGFSIVVNPTANTDYDILLATFTGTGGGAFVITQVNPALDIKGYMIGDDEIDSQHYAPLSIDNEHMADTIVTVAKLNQDVLNAFKGMSGLVSSRDNYSKSGRVTDESGKKLSGAFEVAGKILSQDSFVSPDEDMFEFTVGGYDLTGSNVMHGYIYAYDNSGSPAFYMSMLPPLWDAGKNGWYSPVNPTHRAVFHFSHVDTGSITVYHCSKMSGYDGRVEKTQRLGPWDMDADDFVDLVAEGDPDDAVLNGGMIRPNSAETARHMIPFGSSDFDLTIYTDDTNGEWFQIIVARRATSIFDHVDYNNSNLNRGLVSYVLKQLRGVLSIKTGAGRQWFTASDWVEGGIPPNESRMWAHIPFDMEHTLSIIAANTTGYGFRQDGGTFNMGSRTMDIHGGGWLKFGGTLTTGGKIRMAGSEQSISKVMMMPVWIDSNGDLVELDFDYDNGTKNCVVIPATCTLKQMLTEASCAEGLFRIAKQAVLTFDATGVNSMYGNSGTGQLIVQINGGIICEGHIAGASTYGLTIVCDGDQGVGELRVRANVTLVASAHTTIDTVNGGVWIFDGATGSGSPQLITSAANTQYPDVHLQVNNTWVEMQDNWTVNDMTLDAGTTLDKNGHTLTVNGSLVNNGTIIP